MRRLSRKDIEGIAARVIAAYKNMPVNEGKVLNKVDPELLVHGLLGLNIEYKHLSLDGSILGLTSFGDLGIQVYDDDEDDIYFLDSQTVLIERDLRENAEKHGRCNFTIMHEGSHQIYKMLFPRDYGIRYRTEVHYYRMNDTKSKQITNWEEWQANTLASELILPRECVERSLFLFGFDERIHMLNRIYAPTQYERFKDMAIFLGVSKKALAIRLKQLGLLENDYYDDPFSLIDVRKDDTN